MMGWDGWDGMWLEADVEASGTGTGQRADSHSDLGTFFSHSRDHAP